MKHKHAWISAGLNKALVCSHPQPTTHTNTHTLKTEFDTETDITVTLVSSAKPETVISINHFPGFVYFTKFIVCVVSQ